MVYKFSHKGEDKSLIVPLLTYRFYTWWTSASAQHKQKPCWQRLLLNKSWFCLSQEVSNTHVPHMRWDIGRTYQTSSSSSFPSIQCRLYILRGIAAHWQSVVLFGVLEVPACVCAAVAFSLFSQHESVKFPLFSLHNFGSCKCGSVRPPYSLWGINIMQCSTVAHWCI